MKLTKNQKEFIGTTFITPKGGVLTVTGVVGKNEKDVAIFKLHCTICSDDTELWGNGSITACKSHLKEGKIPCGCTSNGVRWSQDQYKTLLSRCNDREVTFLPEHINNSCKVGVKFKCCGYETFQIVNNILNHSRGCKRCGDILIAKRSVDRGASSEIRIGEVLPNGFIVTGEPKGKGNRKKYLAQCPVCHKEVRITKGNASCGNKGCLCTSNGYDNSKEGRLYLVEWFGFGESYLKKGITNKTTLERIKQQSSKSKMDYRIIREIVGDGKVIEDYEKFLNGYFDGSQCPKKLLPDGYTETVENTPETYSSLMLAFDTLEEVLNGNEYQGKVSKAIENFTHLMTLP